VRLSNHEGIVTVVLSPLGFFFLGGGIKMSDG